MSSIGSWIWREKMNLHKLRRTSYSPCVCVVLVAPLLDIQMKCPTSFACVCAARPNLQLECGYASRVPAFRRLVYFVVVRLVERDYITVARHRTKSFTDSIICYCSPHVRVSVIIDMNAAVVYLGKYLSSTLLRLWLTFWTFLSVYMDLCPEKWFVFSGIVYFWCFKWNTFGDLLQNSS